MFRLVGFMTGVGMACYIFKVDNCLAHPQCSWRVCGARLLPSGLEPAQVESSGGASDSWKFQIIERTHALAMKRVDYSGPVLLLIKRVHKDVAGAEPCCSFETVDLRIH
jgi:hypothetical protein